MGDLQGIPKEFRWEENPYFRDREIKLLWKWIESFCSATANGCFGSLQPQDQTCHFAITSRALLLQPHRCSQKPRRDIRLLQQSSPCHFLQPFWHFPKIPPPKPLLLISSCHNSRNSAIPHFLPNARPAKPKGFTREPWIKHEAEPETREGDDQRLPGDRLEHWYQHWDLLRGVQSGIGEETIRRSTRPIYFSRTCWPWSPLELLRLKASRNRATPLELLLVYHYSLKMKVWASV